MTKDRLRSLSYTELSQIAEQSSISVQDDMDKESLISVIHEAFEEERLDRESSSSLTIQVESKKFSVSQDEELFVDFGDHGDVPERYQDTRIVLMLRDPSWVYCYWDIEDRILDELAGNDGFGGLILRVTELAEPEWGRDSSVDWFDIPIQFEDLRRYINLPTEDSFYGVEIYALVGEREVRVSRSNIVQSSRDYFAPSRGDDNSVRDKLIELSGYSTDKGSFTTESPEIDNPQRIMAFSGDVEN